jgi:hypothetical protein
MRGLRHLDIELVNEYNQRLFEGRLLKEPADATVRRIGILNSLFLNHRGILPHPMYSRDIPIIALLPELLPRYSELEIANFLSL